MVVTTIQQRADALDRIGSEILARQTELGDLLAREEGEDHARGARRSGAPARSSSFRRRGTADRRRVDPLGASRRDGGRHARADWRGRAHHALEFSDRDSVLENRPCRLRETPSCSSPADQHRAAPGRCRRFHQPRRPAGGAFNLVMGRGSEIGPVLVNDRRVAGVSFTGSIATGQSIAQACAARLAKCQLEMGGKNPLVVVDDADVELAATVAVQGAFFSAGQRCTASSRLIVTEGIHDRFVDAVVARMTRLDRRCSPPEGTDIGPVIHDGQLAQNLDYVEIGKNEGVPAARRRAPRAARPVSTWRRRSSPRRRTACARRVRRSSAGRQRHSRA